MGCCSWVVIFVRTSLYIKTSKKPLTKKLSYRKDNRAMRPIYECPENFWESLTIPTATFPEVFNGLFFRFMRT